MAKKSIIDLESFEANAQAAYASQIIARSSSSSSSSNDGTIEDQEPSDTQQQGGVEQPKEEPVAPVMLTKKATTIMPKEVFNKLQMYCTSTDTPKHRAIYMFIIEGLRKATQITEEEYQRYKDMAALLTTTYEKKS